MTNRAHVDPRALREQCSLSDAADLRSADFLRFVVRLSEALDHDISADHWAELTTLSGCYAFLTRLAPKTA